VICEQKEGNFAEDNPDSREKIEFKYPNSKIFVGGLDFKLTNQELKEHFSQFGGVMDAIILKDIFTGQSRGFGFVTVQDDAAAEAAGGAGKQEANRAHAEGRGRRPPLAWET